MSEINRMHPKKLFSIQEFISAYYFEFLPNESYMRKRDRKYDFFTIYFIARGERHIMLDNIEYHLFDGDMALIGPNTVHQILHSENFASNDFGIYTFSCSSPKINKLKNKIFSLTNKERTLMLNAIFSITPKLEHVQGIPSLHGFTLKEDVSPDVLSLSVQYMELLLTTLYLDRFNLSSGSSLLNVGDVYSDAPKETDITSRIKMYLMENLDKKIQLGDVVSHMCMSLSGMEKIFKANTGYSIMEYLHILRLNRIKNLILYSDLNLTEIARRTGFTTIQYFSNFFKKHTGISPREYAKQRTDETLHAGRTLKIANPKNQRHNN